MITLKKFNTTTSSWEEESPKVSITTIVASGTPSPTTFLRGDGSWSTPLGTGTTDDFLRWGAFGAYWDAVTASDVGAASSTHTHGSILNGGSITTNTAPATGQHLMITSSANAIQQSSITFDTNETTFLRRDGTWQTPAGGSSSGTWELIRNHTDSSILHTIGVSGTTGGSVSVTVTLAAGDVLMMEISPYNSLIAGYTVPVTTVRLAATDTTPDSTPQSNQVMLERWSSTTRYQYTVGVSGSGTTLYFDNSFRMAYLDTSTASSIMTEASASLYIGKVWRLTT